MEDGADKGINNWSVNDLLQFERGKTSKPWFIFISCLGYLKNPNEPGAIGLMRRVFNAMIATKEEINKLKQSFPNTPGVVEFAQNFEKSYPMLVSKDLTEQQIMKNLALALVEDQKKIYKDPEAMFRESEQFFNNSELIPDDKRAILKQIKSLSLDEASELIAFRPILAKWENEYISNKVTANSTPIANMGQGNTEKLKGGEQVNLPPIEDPTDQRIWEWIQQDPSITDTDLAQKLGITRQAVNARRRALAKMGYEVRKVSRQKR